jgi:predicted short-subunit dehydrogenase-like oxidoreductase (DUF2520 family)
VRGTTNTLHDHCVLGPGRVGRALAARLSAGGHPVHLGRDPRLAGGSDVVFLCVPDRAVSEVATQVPDGPWVVHCAGALPLAVLGERRRALSIHPLMTFREDGDPSQLDGAYAAVTARDAEGAAVGDALARRLGLLPFPLADEQRVLYHAAAVLASNSLPVVVGAAVRCAALAGIDPDTARRALRPLVLRSAENALAGLSDGGLTGPVARGDAATVESHLAALRDEPALAALYRALARGAVDLLVPERGPALEPVLGAPC